MRKLHDSGAAIISTHDAGVRVTSSPVIWMGINASFRLAWTLSRHAPPQPALQLDSCVRGLGVSRRGVSLTGGVRGRYHFITTTCAIIGGVFTVAGIVDGLVHTGARFAKKVELGKHT